jgi:hypothetical protein
VEVACGSSSSFGLTLHNDRADSTTHWFAVATGPFTIDGPSSGDISGGGAASLTIRVTPPSTARAQVPLLGNLHVSSNDPEHPEQDIPLVVTPRGAMLRVPSFPSELGDIPITHSSPPVTVTVVNDGDLPAELVPTVPTNPRFSVVSGPTLLAPGASGSFQLKFAPDQLGDVTGSLPLATTGPLCGAPELKLHGKGTNGKALVSPGALDFGLVGCGTSAKSQSVTVENTGDGVFEADAALAIGTGFTVAPTHAVLQPGVTASFVVTPSAVPQLSAITPDLYADTLTLTTTAIGDSPHVIPIHETAYGVDISLVSPPVLRGRVDDVATYALTVQNDGNAPSGGFDSPGNVVSTTSAVPVGTSSVSVELHPDPTKLGLDAVVPLQWDLKGAAVCGALPARLTVRAYDTVLDFDSTNLTGCVIGHTKRVYCWGDDNQGGGSSTLPFPPGVYATPQLVVGEAGDRVGMSYSGPWLLSGNGVIRALTWFQGAKLTTLYSLTPPFKQIAPSTGGGFNYGWCALTPAGDMSCVGNNVGGQWANGGECNVTNLNGATAFAGQQFDAMNLGPSGVHALRGGEVYRSTGCTNGNPSYALPSQKISGLANVAQVTSGFSSNCARFTNGTVTCWWVGDPPSGPLVIGLNDAVDVAVRVDGYAIRANGSIVEFVTNGGSAATVSGLTNPVLFKGGFSGACGVRADGALLCQTSFQSNNYYLQPFTPVVGFEGP